MTKQNIEVLELAARTESLLNLYMEAKRELNLHVGFMADVSKFPVVESVREQIAIVRNSIGRGE